MKVNIVLNQQGEKTIPRQNLGNLWEVPLSQDTSSYESGDRDTAGCRTSTDMITQKLGAKTPVLPVPALHQISWSSLGVLVNLSIAGCPRLQNGDDDSTL